MKLIGENFSRNGHNVFKGTVKALQDDEGVTEWADVVNIYDRKAKLKLVENLSTDLSLPLDYARAMVSDLVRSLEAAASSAEALPDDDDAKKSQATKLVDLAKGLNLWHSPDGTPYVTFEVDGHYETSGTHAKSFRIWLSYRFYQEEGQSRGSQAIQDALGTLDGKAIFEGEEHQVFIRVAAVEDAIYLDLANDAWQVVKITAEGWEVVNDSPIRFRRPFGMLSLPTPVKGGNFALLRELLNVPEGEAGDDEWILTTAWVVQALRGEGPYPIAVIQGEQGSAKSSESKVLRRLIDPNKADLRVPRKEERDIMIAASNGLVIAYDNLSNAPEWLANSLCRLSIGGGMGIPTVREKYSRASGPQSSTESKKSRIGQTSWTDRLSSLSEQLAGGSGRPNGSSGGTSTQRTAKSWEVSLMA